VISGKSGKKSDKEKMSMSVNFNLGKTGSVSNEKYDVPTMKLLNPELYKKLNKNDNQLKDPIYESLMNIRERYGYHEMRIQRI
jgi:hypothetical protein